ncbi:hypothetical protein EVAR_83385_1 [Eumeta japonica]|uniref:Uncharacterized protein n=1 Tax=Eumeta variegata TaxID=151549 RepID=A0A4C1TYC3_EUMVA|nr:hypothetical protein EVAR_83385_1 [Eumeta japonica]
MCSTLAHCGSEPHNLNKCYGSACLSKGVSEREAGNIISAPERRPAEVIIITSGTYDSNETLSTYRSNNVDLEYVEYWVILSLNYNYFVETGTYELYYTQRKAKFCQVEVSREERMAQVHRITNLAIYGPRTRAAAGRRPGRRAAERYSPAPNQSRIGVGVTINTRSGEATYEHLDCEKAGCAWCGRRGAAHLHATC